MMNRHESFNKHSFRSFTVSDDITVAHARFTFQL